MIIGLVGRSRVGKDTVAEMLSSKYAVKRLAFPVKRACQEIYGWSEEMVESELKEKLDPHWKITPRTAMVHMTHAVRQFMGTDFFTRRFFDTWDGSPVVIPDVRYESDLEEIHRRGGITIKIVRNCGPRHVFEDIVDILQTTYTIENNGTIEELRRKLTHCTGLETTCAEHPEA